MRQTTILGRSLPWLPVAGVLGLAGTAVANTGAIEVEKEARAKIEGTVAKMSGECPNLRFHIGETRIVTTGQTVYEDGSCRDIENGEVVEVEGKLSADGKLTASEVELEGL